MTQTAAERTTGVPVAASYIDPFGRLERRDGCFVRHVSSEASTWLKPLQDRGVLAAWHDRCNLIPCSVIGQAGADDRDARQDSGWTVSHPEIRPLTLPAEWCGSMLRDAALTTLDMVLAADEEGLTLQDAHPHNVVFDGARPVFVDLTSIVPRPANRIWDAYGQFLDFFRNPLLLHADGKGDRARAMLLNPVRGAPLADVYPLLSLSSRLRRTGLVVARQLDALLQRNGALRRRLRSAAMGGNRPVDPAIRTRFLTRLRRATAAIQPRRPSLDTWASYYDEADRSGLKRQTLDRILRAERPRTVTDIGCNTGRFSILAADAGARVLAIDGSEPCVEALYAAAKTQNAAITPIVADILAPTPAHGFMAGEYAALPERARSEAVLCLGLVHHLLVNGRQTESRVADLVRALARRLAVVELVDPEDENVALLNSARPVTYRSETLADALAQRFGSVELVESDRATRKLAICRS